MSSKPRKAFDGIGRPKSPLDDLGKAIAKAGYGRIAVKEIKRAARGEGFAKSYEKAGIEDATLKRLRNKKLAKTKETAIARRQFDMYSDKQDRVARLYGDHDGPHKEYFRDMELPSRLNKQAHKAFTDEVEIGRKQAQRGNKAIKKMLRPKNTKGKR